MIKFNSNKRDSIWIIILITGLLSASAGTYYLQYFIFHKTEDTIFYMMQDMAFVPIQVLFVTLIVDRLLKKREKQTLFNKLNMLIGIFYHEIGSDIIRSFMKISADPVKIQTIMNITPGEDQAAIKKRITSLNAVEFSVQASSFALQEMKALLSSRDNSLSEMLKNPLLLEHDKFTDLLWAVFHLNDELLHRKSLEDLPVSDIRHLEGDVSRAFYPLAAEWAGYVHHLKNNYPYLFSIALRTNPFLPQTDIHVK